MAKIEVLLVGVLLILALLLGVLIGGSSIWVLKPGTSSGGGQVVERVVSKYVCMDGSVKNSQSECPTTVATSTGQTLTCPVCQIVSISSSNRTLSCTECAARCGAIIPVITTTTLPPCKVCSANSECGQPSYSPPKCKNDQTYKMYSEPFCEKETDGRMCCTVKQTPSGMTQCASAERCQNATGCVAYQDAPE